MDSSITVSDEEDFYHVLIKEVDSSYESLPDINTDLLSDSEYSSTIGHNDYSQQTSMYQSINGYEYDSLFAEVEKLKRENSELLKINKILQTKKDMKKEEIKKLKMRLFKLTELINKANDDVIISSCETQIIDNEEKLFQTENLDDAKLQESTSTHNTEPQEMFKNLEKEFKYINQTIQLGEITTKVIELEDSKRKLIKEICELNEKIKSLQKPSEEVEILKTQLEIYKSDLIVEKQSRELLESSKCDMETQFNTLNIHHKELLREFVRLENMVSGKENSTISLKYLQRFTPSYIFFCPLCQYSAGSIKLLEDHIKLH